MTVGDALTVWIRFRQDRWVARHEARLGGKMPSLWDRLDARFVIALLIILLFAWAFVRTDDKDTINLMTGALIAGFAGAWGFYLGSSASAAMAGLRQDRALTLADNAVKALPAPPAADLTLEPGETAKVRAG